MAQIFKALQSDIISEIISYLIGLLALGALSLFGLYKVFFEKVEKKDLNKESVP